MIRPAQAHDLETVQALVHDAYRHYIARIGMRPGPMNDDYERRIAAGQTWVLDQDGSIAGLVVLEEQPDALLLDNVAVAPAAQGQGLGRRLIAFAEGEARRRGSDQLRLYTHVLMVENLALYQRLGFVEIKRVREKGFARVYMAKQTS